MDEIEKTIQGLLNLNIFETFSNSEDNDSKNNVSEGGADTGTNDVSTSEDKTSAESQSKDTASTRPQERGERIRLSNSKGSTALFGHQPDAKAIDRE